MPNTTPNLAISHIATNQNQKEVTANTAFDELDGAVTGLLAKAFPSDADYTLTSTEGGEAFAYMVYKFSGTISTTRNIIVPAVTKLYVVYNGTTGGHPIVIKTPSGTGITIGNATGFAVLYCDGVNVVRITPDGVTGSGLAVLQTSPTLTTPKVTAYTVAALAGLTPTGGQRAYASDGLKPTESTGFGTGVPVFYSAAGPAGAGWYNYFDCSTLVAA